MITKNKNNKSLMNMLRKMSIIPVALVAMYLFACSNKEQSKENRVNVILTESDNREQTKESHVNVSFTEPIPAELVEVKPEFTNGTPAEEGLLRFLNSNIRYPVEAQEKGIQGRVVTSFIVDENGAVTNASVVESADPLLDAEALRVVNSLPKLKPGKQDGKAVKVMFTLPVVFRLMN